MVRFSIELGHDVYLNVFQIIVVDGKNYLKKIVDRMFELLSEETSISGDGLPMLDMVGSFSELNRFY